MAMRGGSIGLLVTIHTKKVTPSIPYYVTYVYQIIWDEGSNDLHVHILFITLETM